MNIKKHIKRAVDQFMENMGWMRISDHEKFRFSCEEFAKDYLDASSGLTIGSESGFINGGEMYATAVVIGSNVRLSSTALMNGGVVAPWVKNFVAMSCRSEKPVEPKNCRALVRLPNGKPLFKGESSIHVEANK